MSRFPEALLAAVFVAAFSTVAYAKGDADLGAKVFGKCKACHMVGEGAKHRTGPELNDLIGRTAGTAEGYSYSKAMKAAGEAGTVWDEVSLAAYLAAPRDYVRGTKMAFAGLNKEDDVANVIAYLKTFSEGGSKSASAESGTAEKAPPEEKPEAAPQVTATPVATADASPATTASHGAFHLGREASPDEIAAWDIDVRPDGLGLPQGKGTVAQGEALFSEACAACHGDFGEGVDRWPVLAGGQDSLRNERPVKTIGSYWPYLSTVYDYIRRAMPFGAARSLSDDDVYALTAYLLYLNDVVTDEDFELSDRNFREIHLPNEANFKEDDRMSEPQYADKGEPCMTDCKPGKAQITMRAQVLDVTPDGEGDNKGGGVD